MVPYHVQPYSTERDIFRIFFYRVGQEFAAVVEATDGALLDAGSWPTIGEADEFARMVADDASRAPAEADPLARHRARGAKLAVTFDGVDRKYAIVAGYAKGYEDAGPRFDTEAEARRALGAV